MLEQQKLDLGELLDYNHKLNLLLKDSNTAYFAAHSTFDVSEVRDIDRLLLVQSIYAGGKL